METIFARHELHHVSLQGFLFIVHRTCYVVHRDRFGGPPFFSFRCGRVAKYCNASRVAVSSSRAAASTTRFFRAPSFVVVKWYHQRPTRGVVVSRVWYTVWCVRVLTLFFVCFPVYPLG